VHGVSSSLIDDLLKYDAGLQQSVKQSLKSIHIVYQMIDPMCDGYGHSSWMKHTTNFTWNSSHSKPIEFNSQDIILCNKWLFRHKAYDKNLMYAPECIFSNDGRRLYNVMHTADWWWETQVYQLSRELRKLF
jgi:hypothetical protein